jgi:hypothetical protein
VDKKLFEPHGHSEDGSDEEKLLNPRRERHLDRSDYTVTCTLLEARQD